MSDEFLPYGSQHYTSLVTKQGCQAKFVAPMLAPYGSRDYTSLNTKQETSKAPTAGATRLVRRNARPG
jgi:hypothetical protein